MSFALVQVQVNDVNDNPPLFSQHNYSAFVHVSIIYIISIPYPVKKKKDFIIFFYLFAWKIFELIIIQFIITLCCKKKKKSKQNL